MENTSSGCEKRAHQICHEIKQKIPGIEVRSLQKIWIFPKSPNQKLDAYQSWEHHVAVVVKTTDSGELVLDPIAGGVVDENTWTQKVGRKDGNHILKKAAWEIEGALRDNLESGTGLLQFW